MKKGKTMFDFSNYKTEISKTIESDGIGVRAEYNPSRPISQMEKCVREKKRLVPFKSLTPDWSDANLEHFGPVKESIEEADIQESNMMFEDFAKVLAMLTDDEMLARIISQAKRKKDGHLMANRIAFECDLDGITRGGEYFKAVAKSDKNDVINIEVSRERLISYATEPGGDYASCVLREYEDIAKRMGLA